jgi:hypothetical protein
VVKLVLGRISSFPSHLHFAISSVFSIVCALSFRSKREGKAQAAVRALELFARPVSRPAQADRTTPAEGVNYAIFQVTLPKITLQFKRLTTSVADSYLHMRFIIVCCF